MGLGHIEHSVFWGSNERAKSEIKHTNNLISSTLKNFFVDNLDNKKNILDSAWIDKDHSCFKIHNCTKILSIEQEKMFHELDLNLKCSDYKITDGTLRKIMKTCF